MKTTIHRPALMAALCAGGLCVAALVPLACGSRKGVAGLVQSSPIRFFPRESAGLLVLDIKKIRAFRPDTPWLKNMASLADREGGPIAEITRRLGPDVLSRLDRLSLAVVPRPDRLIGYGVLAEGSFDGARLREALGGNDFLTVVEAGPTDFSVAILKDGSLALGPKQVLLTMRANDASGGHGLDANTSIMGPLEKVRPEGQFWGAVDCRSLQQMYKDASGPSDLGGLSFNSAPVQALLTIAFRGMVGDTVDIDMFGKATGEADAKTLSDAARGLVALGRVGAGRDQAKEWLEFLDGIRIRQSGADIELRASIPAKTMETFVGQMTSNPPPAAEAAQSPAPPHEAAPQPPAARPSPAKVVTPPRPAPGAKVSPRSPAAPRPSASSPAESAPPADSSRLRSPEPRDTPRPSEGAP